MKLIVELMIFLHISQTSLSGPMGGAGGGLGRRGGLSWRSDSSGPKKFTEILAQGVT